MKKLYFSIFSLVILTTAHLAAQQVQWLNTSPINFSQNPELTQQPACVSGNKVYAVRMVDFALNNGLLIYGSMSLDCHDAGGSMLWSFPMGPKLAVESITADAAGNVYVSGSFIETLNLNGNDSLLNTGGAMTTNLFLLSLDVSGNLRWKRNVALTHPDAFSLPALSIDPQNNCWYGCVYFDSTTIQKLDVNGNDLQSHLIEGTRTLGNFSFDPNGNMFLAGSTGFQMLSINGFSVNVPEPYMMFVARINASGNTSWIHLVHDVTFQLPRVAATVNGDAYVSGNLMDSAVFGNVTFHHPEWVYDIFLTKTDSAGNFSWGVQVPHMQVITGDFQRGRNNFLDVDAMGNVYLTGSLRGSIDWGNGVVTNSGSVTTDGHSIISFDNNGVPRWQVTGTATGSITPYSICVAATDECYFSSAVSGTLSFDSLTANQGGNFAFALGKINATAAGTGDISPDETMTVFPNPAVNQFTMHIPIAIGTQFRIGTPGMISIFNMMGELVMQVQASKYESNTVVDVTHLPSGMYVLQTGNARTKITVQHH